MKKLVFLAILLMTSSFAFASNSDISGKYHCKGTDPFSQSEYQGSLFVTKTDQTFQFIWDLGNFHKYLGTGFYVEGIDHFIPVTVVSLNKKTDPQNPYHSELQVYKIGSDGTLTGWWTFLGKSKVSPKEICTKILK